MAAPFVFEILAHPQEIMVSYESGYHDAVMGHVDPPLRNIKNRYNVGPDCLHSGFSILSTSFSG